MTTVTITSSVLLNAPPTEVFDYVSDLSRHPEWSGGPLQMEALSSAKPGVGAQYRSRGGPNERINDLRVSVYEPPTGFAFIASDAKVGEITHNFTFEPQAGQTLMRRTVTGNFPLFAAPVFRLFIYPNNGKPLMEKAFAKLKAKWEPNVN